MSKKHSKTPSPASNKPAVDTTTTVASHYARIYYSHTAIEEGQYIKLYRGVIWSGDDGKLLKQTADLFSQMDRDPGVSFDKLCELAAKMDRPVDIFRHGNGKEPYTITPGLPF